MSRAIEDLKGRYVEFLSPDDWKGGGIHIQKVVKIHGKRLTMMSGTGVKRRLPLDRVSRVVWRKKLIPLEEWLKGGK